MFTPLGTIRKYFFQHPRRIGGALVMSLVGLALNAGSLALLAAMTQMALEATGMDTGISATGGQITAPPISLDVNAWYDYLGLVLNSWLATRGLLWTLLTLAGLYLLVRGLYAVSEVFNVYLLWSVRSLAARQMMYDMFAHVSQLSMDFFNRSRVGELGSRLINDIDQYATELFKIVLIMVTSLPLAVFYWVTLLRTNARLSLVAVLSFGASYMLVQKLGGRIQREVIRLSDTLADVATSLQESFSGITLVKAYAAERVEQARLGRKLDRNLPPAIRKGMFERGIRPINRLLQDVPAVLVLLYGAFLVLSERIEVASLILFVFLLRQVRGPTTELIGGSYFAYRIAQGFSQRLRALHTEQPGVPDGEESVQGFTETLALQGVSFNYEAGTTRMTLGHIDLEVRKGEVVALVGPSGAGKSTLVNLLLRFYDPGEGRVLLDGQDIRAFRQESYRRLFGVVSQETILFHDSVRNNIAYGLPPDAVTDDEIVAAARIANAHDFIVELPEGYDTIVGDRGLRLSGGQRQRLAIARAVLRNPAILILDEATSSLDSESELLVQEAIERLLVARTAVVIAHRLSTIRNADRIVVMDEGRIVETGTHDELLANGGAYRRLYQAQVLHDAALPDAGPQR